LGTLIDSSIFIAAERGDIALRSALTLLDPFQDYFISAVTVFELLHGVHRADTPVRRATREAHSERFIKAIPIIPSTREPHACSRPWTRR
jgi:predicted nucleic acid-binding protein